MQSNCVAWKRKESVGYVRVIEFPIDLRCSYAQNVWFLAIVTETILFYHRCTYITTTTAIAINGVVDWYTTDHPQKSTSRIPNHVSINLHLVQLSQLLPAPPFPGITTCSHNAYRPSQPEALTFSSLPMLGLQRLIRVTVLRNICLGLMPSPSPPVAGVSLRSCSCTRSRRSQTNRRLEILLIHLNPSCSTWDRSVHSDTASQESCMYASSCLST